MSKSISRGKNTIKYVIVILIAIVFLIPLQAQQLTGNIVEIFGREKIETTSEGTIIHEFTDGLALRDALRPGMLTGTRDILFWAMATGQFESPEEGQSLSFNYSDTGKDLVWQYIEADTSNTFKGELKNAYIYTQFDSPEETIALLDAKGHTRVFINGMPNEGDHYDYGYTLIPFQLHKGVNQFIYTDGRFGRLRSKIIIPHKPLQFTSRDMTLPSVIRGERNELWGAIRVINAAQSQTDSLFLKCVLESGESVRIAADKIMPMAVRKLKFKIPAPARVIRNENIKATLILEDNHSAEVDRIEITLKVLNSNQHHERTFVSAIDESVQYYSIAPSTRTFHNQSLILSLHGASVEATNQVRAYIQKDWGHIIAPTNRRPFGFNWEEWGRLDALEVLHQARMTFPTDTSQTYLIGHSMGGHGAWSLGATYPDKWAAIAPAAGYPDIIGYRTTGTDSLMEHNIHFPVIYRSALAGRTLDLLSNYKQSGVYVLHGDADKVVPVSQARMMRRKLSEFHPNFSYFETPDGTHWDGDHSMDWPPLFDFLRQNTIPAASEVKEIDFITASPGISSTNYWMRINQQHSAYKHSRVIARIEHDTLFITTANIAHLSVLFSLLKPETPPVVAIDGQYLSANSLREMHMRHQNGRWILSGMPHLMEKHPDRFGGFKLAFTNRMMFVYATNGSAEENQWYKNKARFDAETFLYRGNGSIDIVADTVFTAEKYRDRNVIIYGNAENNNAWNSLLGNSSVLVMNNGIQMGERFMEGDHLATFFVQPRHDSQNAMIGVVAATGEKGMKALYPNDYFSGITGFPDLLIFDISWIRDGLDGVLVSGFFGNDWSVATGEFRIKPTQP
jgi:predicted peptidase